MTAYGDIISNDIHADSSRIGNGAKVELTSQTGRIDTNGYQISATNTGNAGSVILKAYQDIVVGDIAAFSVSTGNGGKVELTSQTGRIDTNGKQISTTANAGNAGNVVLNAYQDIAMGEIDAYSIMGNGGRAELTSQQQGIKVGNIFTQSLSGDGVWKGGKVTLKAKLGSIDGTVESGDIITTSVNGNAGAVTIEAGGNIETGNITTTSIAGNAGKVTLEAGGDIEAGAIASNTFAGSGKGGNITLDGKNITAESLRADSVGADGGQIKLTADKFIQITGSTSVNGKDYSIFTDSKDVDPSPNDTGARSAPILIRHSQKVRDESLTPFIVGDSSKNGTATSISDGIVDFGVSSGNTREVYDFNFNFNDIYIKRPFALLADISNILGIPGVPILKKESNIIDNILKFLPYIPALATSDIQSISNSVVSLLSRISKQELLNLGLGIQKVDLDKYYSLLITAMAISGINSVDNQAHFLTQLIHESDRFISTSEKYNGNDYTYFENKYGYLTEAGMDLGNTKLGDGSNFRGRGLIQITGRDAYKQFGEYLGFGDLFINAPKLVSSDPIFAVLSSIWFWTSDYKNGVIRINTNNQFSSFREIAEANNIPNNDPLDLNGDKSDRVEGITLSLNGGYNGLEDRKLIFNKIRNASVG
jgi:predicted chitinase